MHSLDLTSTLYAIQVHANPTKVNVHRSNSFNVIFQLFLQFSSWLLPNECNSLTKLHQTVKYCLKLWIKMHVFNYNTSFIALFLRYSIRLYAVKNPVTIWLFSFSVYVSHYLFLFLMSCIHLSKTKG